ncbi:SDR family NAD(P)-dependent oxidoreductase [Mucilaginibacter myungsuensis]|uniref:SDR family NAD(P)-dependent oxidoreductase n=2 Tax=Mucilaginibacter myungsuensis TaxID=649104 RepID=A0A929PXC5_9SPHI|nr:SDR family NAD(P)-dependent oxidoreductase [Mucilaginibacter myungsuensis]
MAGVLAQKGYNLIVAARTESDLQQLAADIKAKYPVDVRYITIDLSKPGAAQQLTEQSLAISSNISILINNAGYGLWDDFEKLELQSMMDMMQVNMNALVSLTHLLLPTLKAQQQSYILNVASTASYQSVPYLTLYAASKAFVLSFSRGLSVEFKDTNVSVTCLSPGATATNFTARANMQALDHITDKVNMQPLPVAEFGIKAMFAKKTEVIPGFMNKLSAWGGRHMPKALVERVAGRLYGK